MWNHGIIAYVVLSLCHIHTLIPVQHYCTQDYHGLITKHCHWRIDVFKWMCKFEKLLFEILWHSFSHIVFIKMSRVHYCYHINNWLIPKSLSIYEANNVPLPWYRSNWEQGSNTQQRKCATDLHRLKVFFMGKSRKENWITKTMCTQVINCCSPEYKCFTVWETFY